MPAEVGHLKCGGALSGRESGFPSGMLAQFGHILAVDKAEHLLSCLFPVDRRGASAGFFRCPQTGLFGCLPGGFFFRGLASGLLGCLFLSLKAGLLGCLPGGFFFRGLKACLLLSDRIVVGRKNRAFLTTGSQIVVSKLFYNSKLPLRLRRIAKEHAPIDRHYDYGCE